MDASRTTFTGMFTSCAIACVAFSVTGCVGTHSDGKGSSPGSSKTAGQAAGTYRFQELSFTPFSNMRVLPDSQKDDGNAAAELMSRDDYRDYPQRIEIFYQQNSVGNIGIRLAQIKQGAKAELSSSQLQFTDDRDIKVAGTVQSHLLSYKYVDTDDDGTKITMVQHDVILGTARNPQYGLRISSPAPMYRPAELQRLLRTMRVG